jgi:hypothetical protein
MGGREAIRGFAVQTLICLLDSLEVGENWTAVTIEPDSDNDKVDLLWEYDYQKKKAVQVKSSKNPIGQADVIRWCKALKSEKIANTHELRLAGPVAVGAIKAASCEGVIVPPPSSVIVRDLIEQAVTKLDRYLTSSGIDSIPLSIRESLVDICASKLIYGSSAGTRVSRTNFDGWLLHWVTAAYPGVLHARLSANCDFLWGGVEFMSPLIGQKAFQLRVPLSIYNSGNSVSIVEWLIILVRASSRRMLYRANAIVQNKEVLPFAEFAIAAHQVVEKKVHFLPVEKIGFQNDSWPLGIHDIEIIISADHMALLSRDNSMYFSDISTLDGYLETL